VILPIIQFVVIVILTHSTLYFMFDLCASQQLDTSHKICIRVGQQTLQGFV